MNSEWMSVMDGVPDHEIEVLTYSRLDGFVLGTLHDTANGGEEWRDDAGCEYDPTHWRPLPEAPR